MKSITLLLISSVIVASENNVIEVPTLANVNHSWTIQGEENMFAGDDSRTFSLTSAYEWGNNRILFNYDMLTQFDNYNWERINSGLNIRHNTVLRTDRLDGIYSYKFGDDSLYLRAGTGFRLYSNLGGGELQTFIHRDLLHDFNTTTPSALRHYDDKNDLAALGQIISAGIIGDRFGGFFNMNADASTSEELNASGFAGIHINKTFFVGGCFNQEINPVSETARSYHGTPRDENNIGIRLAFMSNHFYSDICYTTGMGHFRVGFTF